MNRQYSERAALATQYRKGSGVDNDADEDECFRPVSFAVGCDRSFQEVSS